MKERPILFSAAMVRAILGGSKTQTRRVVKAQATEWDHFAPEDDVKGRELFIVCGKPEPDDHSLRPILTGISCPYGQPGDRLWVRETFAGDRAAMIYASDFTDEGKLTMPRILGFKWRPSIHMPRWASRINLEITGVRVERLQDITPEDALAEGIMHCDFVHELRGQYSADELFSALWESTYPGNWNTNPWVWVIEFRRIK